MISTTLGGESFYNARFGEHRIPPRERKLLLETLQSNIKDRDTVTILDYGCGDGRFMPVYMEFADILKQQGKKLELICLDISSTALDELSKNSCESGFESVDDSKLKKDNVTLALCKTDGSAKSLNGLNISPDVSISMFGVISHVPTQQERKDLLTTLRKITTGQTILTVSGKEHFKKQIKSTGSRDIKYKAFTDPATGSDVFNNIHVYTLDELKDDLHEAGFSVDSLGVSTFKHPAKLSKEIETATLDEYGSKLATKFSTNSEMNKGCYLYAIGHSLYRDNRESNGR